MSDLALYTDPSWGFSFPYPAAWEVRPPAADAAATVVLGEPGTQGFRPNLVATLTRTSDSLEAWEQQTEDNLADGVPAWRMLERVLIEDRPAPTLLTTAILAGPAGESLTQLTCNALHEGLGLALSATCHTWDFPALRAVFMELFAGVTPPRAAKEQ